MKVSEALINGRDFLQTHKWGRNDYYDPDRRTYCAVGALFSGNFGEGYWLGLKSSVTSENKNVAFEAEEYLDRAIPGVGITGFNDHNAKRKRDVISVFNKAIKLAQQDGK